MNFSQTLYCKIEQIVQSNEIKAIPHNLCLWPYDCEKYEMNDDVINDVINCNK